MADSRFLRIFSAIERRRGLVTGLLLAIVALSGLSLLRLQFDNTLDLMLPSKSPAQRMLVVNNLVSRAMNAAAAEHWPQVNAQVVAGC